MRRLLVFLAIMLACSGTAHAAEFITQYRTVLAVNADSTVRVTETIAYDFGDAQKHGIFRDIAVDSPNGPHLVVSDIAVTRDGAPEPFTTSEAGAILNVRIGDPNVTFSGPHIYVLTYTVHNAVRYFTEHDELYWNAIPTGFTVPIADASADIAFPAGATIIDASCDTGEQGTAGNDCTAVTDSGSVHVTATRMLGAYEGMTVSASVRPGIIARVAPVAESRSASFPWPVIVFAVILPLLGVIPGIIIVSSLFYRHSLPRHRSDGGDIVVQYDPPEAMSASRCGYLAGKGDIFTAAVLQLAVNGWLQLEFSTTKHFIGSSREITFSRRKSGYPDDTFDRQILDIVTPGEQPLALSTIKDRVRRRELSIRSVLSSLGSMLEREGYLMRGGLFHMFLVPTPQGVAATEHIAGLRIYLNAAEKERLEFHDAPAKSPETFEALLPYAVALGVDKPWRQEFQDVYRQPEWAKGDFDGTALGFGMAMANLSSDLNAAVNAYSSGSSSSGGGFSGGGSGGGGGGSW